MLGDVVTASADGITRPAVVTENRCICVETREAVCIAGVRLQGGSVEDVVGLVGSVSGVSPYNSSSNFITLDPFRIHVYDPKEGRGLVSLTGFSGRRGSVNPRAPVQTPTTSKHIAHNVGSL